MAPLQFWLFGPLQVWRGAVRLDTSLPGERTKTLLALLLTERGHFVSSDRALDCIWPHLDSPAAANNLQVAVRQLRRWLEPGLKRGPDSHFLITEPGGYRLITRDCYLDVDEFARVVQRGQAALRLDDLTQAQIAFERARQLYRDDYLSDQLYTDWVLPTRERLRESHLQVLESLANTCLRLGLPENAIDLCRQGLAIDNFRESFVRHLMRGQAALGRRAEALAAYAQCESLLLRELAIQPSPETRAVRDAILAENLPELATPPASRVALSSAIELPLVGRAETLSALQAAWAKRDKIVSVSGVAGVGKTRLLNEFANSLKGRVFWSRAREGDAPFEVVLRILNSYFLPDVFMSAVETLGPLAAPLIHYLSGLHDRLPDPPIYTALSGQAERERLHQAILAALRLAAAEPALFILDDAQWAGSDSISVFSELLRNPLPEALFVLGCRSEEINSNDPLEKWIAVLRKADRLIDIELSPLTFDHVVEVVRAVTGAPDPQPISQRLNELTHGLPLFLAESLRALFDSGQLTHWLNDAGSGEVSRTLAANIESFVSSTLRETILTRANHLAPKEREVLLAAAVLRQHCNASNAAALLHESEDSTRVGEALRTLTAKRWLLNLEEAQAWEFSHQLISEVIYDNIAEPLRRLLHRLAAEALIAAYSEAAGEVANEVVEHLRRGDGAPTLLAQWGVLAGQRAYRQFAHTQARQYFELARDCLYRLADPQRDPILELQALEGLSLAQQHSGQNEDALATLESALPLALQARDRMRVLSTMARVCQYDLGDYDRALSLLAEAESTGNVAGIREPAAMGEIRVSRALVFYWRGQFAEGAQMARQAIEDLQHTPEESRALTTLGLNLHKLGQVEDAIELYRRTYQLSQAAGDLRGLAVANVNMGNGYLALGRLADALNAYKQGGAIFQRLDDVRRQSVVEVNFAIAANELGDLARAEAALRQAIQLAESVNAPYTVALARHVLGKTLTLRGRWDDARDQFEAALTLAESIKARMVMAQTQIHYGQWCWWQGDSGGAESRAQTALEIGEPLGDNFTQREARLLLSNVSLAQGNLEAAERYAGESREIAAQARQAMSVGRAERALGQIKSAQGDWPAAGACFDESERIFREIGAQVELGQTLLAQAQVGWPGETVRHKLAEARRLFRLAGAVPLLKKAELLLKEMEFKPTGKQD